MSPHIRTPQQRDRRFTRVRRITQSIFVGAGAASAVLVGFNAANAKPVTTHAATTHTTTAPTTTPAAKAPAKAATTRVVSTPVKAPVTTTTVCTTSPSGTVTCY